MLQERIQEVRNKVAELVARANQLYSMTLPPIDLRFDLRGRCAGQAGRKNGRFYMRFNTDMMQTSGWDHIINDTVPHELAHIICFYRPELGRQHNPGWKRVCKQMGGTGARCHSEEVVYAKGKTYAYTTTTGAVVNLSQAMHGKIQRGAQYRIKERAGGGQLNNACAWIVVGEPQQQVQRAAEAPRPRMQSTTETRTGTKAEQIRAKIREVRSRSGNETEVIAWGVHALGMKTAQAQRYVKENWSRA